LGVRAFKLGMAPVVIALLVSTGWLLTAGHNQPSKDWPLWLLTAVAMLLVWRTRIHLLWLIGAGAVIGGLGWI
jgi:chromate transporter